AVQVRIQGVSVHPGFAKGKMVSALKIAAEVVARLPQDKLSPESTSGKQGFIHPTAFRGGVDQAEIGLIIRDHNTAKLREYEEVLRNIVSDVVGGYPAATYSFEVVEQYRNMKEILDQVPEVMTVGMEGIELAGLTPGRRSIRGGTAGSRLWFMGLPCPNVFAGGHAFHGKLEWVSRQDMENAVQTILNFADIWQE